MKNGIERQMVLLRPPQGQIRTADGRNFQKVGGGRPSPPRRGTDLQLFEYYHMYKLYYMLT